MKKVFSLLLVAALYSCSACNKDSNNSNNNGSNPDDNTAINGCGGSWDVAKGRITFKVNGTQVNSINHTCSWSDAIGFPIINITSSMHKDGRTVNLNVGGWSTGNRVMTSKAVVNNSEAQGVYAPHYCDYEMAIFQSGAVNITRFDTTARIVEGTFSGIAEKDGTKYEITDGRIINCQLERF